MKALELEKLEMKLLATEHKVLEKGMDKSVHVIQFEPTNPDWVQYNIPVLQAIVVFPVTYPEQLFSIKLVDDGKLSKSCLEAINTELHKEIKLMSSDKLTMESPIFRSVLNWLDNNIAQIVGKNLEDEKPDKPDIDPDNYETDESSEYSGSNEEDDDEGSEDETGDLKYLRPVKRGTEVRMMDLQLSKSVATLHFWSMKMAMQCTRCRNIQDVVCKPESIISQMCSHCHSSFSINIHSDILHAANTSLAFMDLLGCKPIDVVLSSCESVVTCLDCGRENLLKGLSFGQPSTTWCRGCNARLLIGVEQCKFFVHQPGVQNAAMVDMSDRKTGKKKMREKILQEGTPLPDLGTCEHYKKSHRWLRFPCCGKTYPCDVCHDLTEDHPMERANRMICGYCSKEQTYTGIKPCVLCGSDMAYVKGSVFWEGGKGCRNRSKMSRKDVHKYKTSENKSASKKNERVGVKGKINRDTK